MKRIKQPTRFTCIASVACMITNTKIQDWYSFHNCDGDKSCHIEDLFRYIAHYDYFSMPFFIENNESINFNDITFSEKFKNITCVVIVSIDRPKGEEWKGDHCLAWDGKRLIDPECPWKFTELDHYKIYRVWPIAKFKKVVYDR